MMMMRSFHLSSWIVLLLGAPSAAKELRGSTQNSRRTAINEVPMAESLLFGGIPGVSEEMPAPEVPSGSALSVNRTIVHGLQPSCDITDKSRFDVCLDIGSTTGQREPWMDAFGVARDRWEELIVGDMEERYSAGLNKLSTLCSGFPEIIDDVYICAHDGYIDGPRNVLGMTATVSVRGGVFSNQPVTAYTGIMKFETSDIEYLIGEGRWEGIVKHEMAHVFGIGSMWLFNGLYSPGTGEYKSGTHAEREFQNLGCNGRLPVELDGEPGNKDAHWDDDCLGEELMTGFLRGTSLPISRVTLGSLQDMGFTVNYEAADPFTKADLGNCVIGGTDYCSDGTDPLPSQAAYGTGFGEAPQEGLLEQPVESTFNGVPPLSPSQMGTTAQGQAPRQQRNQRHKPLSEENLTLIHNAARNELKRLRAATADASRANGGKDSKDIPIDTIQVDSIDVIFLDDDNEIRFVSVEWDEEL